MNLAEMSMDELLEARSAIPAELEAEDADLDALEERAKAINAEIESRNKAAEQRQAILDSVVAGKEDTVKEFTDAEENRDMADVMEVRNSKEYIDAYAEYIKTGEDAECRKLISENGTNGQVAVPDFVYEVTKTAWDEDGVMSLVKKSYVQGNLKVGFEISADGAVIHAEGTDRPNEENLTLGIVTLVPASIKKWITVTDEVMDLRGESFLNYVYAELAHRIAKKAADELIAQIEALGTVSTSTQVSVPVVSEAEIGLGTIAKAIAELSDEAANPAIVMNKLTWSAFKEVQYEGNYAVDPFEGLKVVFNNTVKAYAAATTGETYAIVGDFGQGALANFPNGEGITFKFDDLSLAEADLVKIVGREYVGLGIVAPKAFVKIQK